MKKRAAFKVGIRSQTKEDLMQEVYSPSPPLDFAGSSKLSVYECTPAQGSLAWKRHLPKVPIAALSTISIYKLFFAYTGFIWGLLPLCPVIVLSVIQRNLNENCESQV